MQPYCTNVLLKCGMNSKDPHEPCVFIAVLGGRSGRQILAADLGGRSGRQIWAADLGGRSLLGLVDNLANSCIVENLVIRPRLQLHATPILYANFLSHIRLKRKSVWVALNLYPSAVVITLILSCVLAISFYVILSFWYCKP